MKIFISFHDKAEIVQNRVLNELKITSSIVTFSYIIIYVDKLVQ